MNSWKFPGKKSKEPDSQAMAPASPSTSVHHHEPKSGVLVIRICEAQGIVLPPGVNVPDLHLQQRTSANLRGNRDSLNRKQNWWLPYIVLEFDKNEILIDALGGDTQNPVYQYKANFDVSRTSDVTMSIYLRQKPVNGQLGSLIDPIARTSTSDVPLHLQQKAMQGVSSTSQDYFLGMVKLQPNFDSTMLEDKRLNIAGGSGVMHVQLCYKPQQQGEPITQDSFELLKVIGRGSFGKVYVVRKKDTNRIYAMKVLRKSRIISRSEVTHTMAEKTVLAKVSNPFIVPLKFAFQSPDKLYLVLAFINGGELFHHLQMEARFSEERSRFYTAELLCALECLHSLDVVYRDLKPENILIDYNGHIALCDFGLCKLNMTEEERTNTFCGTPEYLAPELLLGQGYTKSVDWWTLGVLLYEMMTGLPPFYDDNTNEMYRKILQDELRFPEDMSLEAQSLLRGLLTRDPNERLGHNGSEVIKAHPFFASIDWRKLMQKKVQPPFTPSVESIYDTQNFDEEFTSEAPQESVVDESHISKTLQEQFAGFTYNPTNDALMGDSYNGSMPGSAGVSVGSHTQPHATGW